MECLHLLFQQQALRTPEALAVVDETRSLTYAELDRESDRLAGYLQAQGVGADDCVGLYLPKSTDYVVGCLAALKAGGAFLPVFLDYPEVLLMKVLEQTRPKVVLTNTELKSNLPSSTRTLCLDQPWSGPPPERAEVTDENLMFVVFSSGTTGEPKGIQQPHRAAVHSYQKRCEFSPYQPGQRVACNIFFVWEIFRPLLHGATVYVIGDEVIYDPVLLSAYLEDHAITEVLFTPSLLEAMLNQLEPEHWGRRFKSLEVIWLNGEVVTERLRAKALRALPPSVRLLNTYSISECHDVSNSDLRKSPVSASGFCPVGYPIDGIEVRLMHPQGEVGELYVAGPGVARGYLDKPLLTRQRFVELDGKRYYRTGDLAVQHPDGLLEVRGRCDSVVKIRGYSVHLGAVQSALESLPQVESAAAHVVGEEGREKTLVGYLVAQGRPSWKIDPRTGASADLRALLSERLSGYMLPNLFMQLEELPLNPTTGKLDAARLPAPPRRISRPADEVTLESGSPRQVMKMLWARVLGLEDEMVTPESNFFDLGGHSLMAVRLVNHLERVFAVRICVKELYEYPVLDPLLERVENGNQGPVVSSRPRAEEAQLPPSLKPVRTEQPVLLKASKGVLVTGGTGFLGAHLIDRVLRATTDIPVYCLARGQAQQRLEANLAHYGLELSPRLRGLSGDLTRERLGLPADDYQRLVQQTDCVFHCAALVNYVHNYKILKPHTVDGTRRILELTAEGCAKSLHYISTNGIFPGGGAYFENRDIDGFLQDLQGGYGLAKWVAEKLVWQAVDRGLHAIQYRPGNIGHASDQGVPNPNDFQYLMVRACQLLGFAPEVEGWYFELTPVDYLVDAIVGLADRAERFGQVFNVVQQPTTPAGPVFREWVERGILKGFLPLTEWLDRLHQLAAEQGEDQLEVLANSLPDVEGYLRDTSRYDGAHFRAATAEVGVKKPATGIDYLELMLEKNYLAKR